MRHALGFPLALFPMANCAVTRCRVCCWDRMTLAEFEHRRLRMFGESIEVRDVMPQQLRNVFCPTVAESKPHDLRRCTAKHTQAVEILVLRDQETVSVASDPPHILI